MAYLQEQMKILKYDKRLLEINLKSGSITQDEYNKYLAQLSDMQNASEKLVLDESNHDDFNGSGPSQAEPKPSMTPPSSDPFGSGF